MFDKVICPFYSVGYCKFKDQCRKEHPKEDCRNSSCQKRVVLKDIGNNVNKETFVEDTIKIKAVNSHIFMIIKKLTFCQQTLMNVMPQSTRWSMELLKI